MLAEQHVCLRKLGGRRAAEVQFGRFLANAKVTPEKILASAYERTAHAAAARHVLAIQDTTELNYQAHADRVRGLGRVGNGVDAGFFLHPLLALDAADGSCL
ncbi:MAG: transposase, partial [Pseudomonadota bacterium]